MNAAEVARGLLRDGSLDLPDPAGGRTALRHRALFDIARHHSGSVARLAEAHTDAVSILRAAGREPRPGALYGVWASVGADDVHLVTRCQAATDWSQSVLVGTKPFASGLGIVDRALVTARLGRPGTDDNRARSSAPVLVDVEIADVATIATDVDGWSTTALADSATGSVTFDEHPVDDEIVGPPGWYLDRVGFWHGACGPAACWAGGAAGLVDVAERLIDHDLHRRAHLGAMRSDRWTLLAVLEAAGREIDVDSTDPWTARQRALAMRHRVERLATDVLDRFGQALGPRPFAHMPDVNQRWLDTHLALRQNHAERDLELLGADPVVDATAQGGDGDV